MQNHVGIERSKAAQQAQTIKVRPKWHMTVLHIVYYLIMVVFLVFYMLPFWGTVMTSFTSAGATDMSACGRMTCTIMGT